MAGGPWAGTQPWGDMQLPSRPPAKRAKPPVPPLPLPPAFGVKPSGAACGPAAAQVRLTSVADVVHLGKQALLLRARAITRALQPCFFVPSVLTCFKDCRVVSEVSLHSACVCVRARQHACTQPLVVLRVLRGVRDCQKWCPKWFWAAGEASARTQLLLFVHSVLRGMEDSWVLPSQCIRCVCETATSCAADPWHTRAHKRALACLHGHGGARALRRLQPGDL